LAAAEAAEAAAAKAAGTQAADLVDNPPFRRRQGDQDWVRDDHSGQALPPPTCAGPMWRPAITKASTGLAGHRAPAPGRSPKNPASQTELGRRDA